ncbi:30S ribosomal protein S16 [Candidatus Jorgensenbacteria bacterium RIFCSPLOWO2_02_FULL_45_12]|uniref:Small ribosomal subunit protein bS16 n=2 Tax=Candidatus Joergenseniibacteriota TaxID=1752739 RepID=A0A1F6BPI9_9BACT|nr:MAG: 30S ribosomal protein S16 [Candidatus Jorgensenbacteria bacterium GW2011_GWA2_45_9]OGG38835.1 MAG: 30S ribosomal protein S16 [Candidatus Jorgensenbacteria bacterium RIFCSPHIGHO2_02_FULL_45_20]OGG42221.1 MAG: 30S ribosomal protein S16 [Candidatus Jorgensenbacteria bacterium RIFCSPLOWO2_02_FULL_45_12]
MLAIKLRPVGKKKQRTYRVVVMERRSKLNGRFIDDLGWLNPHTDKFDISTELVKKWISNGAQPTKTVADVLVKAGVMKAPAKKKKVSRK